MRKTSPVLFWEVITLVLSLATLTLAGFGNAATSDKTAGGAKRWQEDESEEVLERQKYFAMRRAGGLGKHVPPNAYAAAVKQAARVPNTRDFFSNPFSGISWVNYNPSGLFYEVTNNNTISGRTNSFAFAQDPK